MSASLIIRHNVLHEFSYNHYILGGFTWGKQLDRKVIINSKYCFVFRCKLSVRYLTVQQEIFA